MFSLTLGVQDITGPNHPGSRRIWRPGGLGREKSCAVPPGQYKLLKINTNLGVF